MTDVLFTSDDIEWMIRVSIDTNQIFEDDSRRVGNGNKAWETDVNIIFEEGLHLVHCYPVFFSIAFPKHKIHLIILTNGFKHSFMQNMINNQTYYWHLKQLKIICNTHPTTTYQQINTDYHTKDKTLLTNCSLRNMKRQPQWLPNFYVWKLSIQFISRYFLNKKIPTSILTFSCQIF